MSDPLTMFCALVVGHALCDYPLQGDFLAKAKSPAAPIPGVPWWWAMSAHAAIHGGAVALVTGNVMIGVLEALCHFVIDSAKCCGVISFNADQWAHVACKALWVALAVSSG